MGACYGRPNVLNQPAGRANFNRNSESWNDVGADGKRFSMKALKLGLLALTALALGCGSKSTVPPSQPSQVSITPASATVQTNATQQFTAGNAGVTWSVNGKVGGSSTTGLISPSGLYTAPSLVPTNAEVIITAQTSSASGTATVTISTAAQAPINLTGTTWEISLTSASNSAQNGNIYNSLLSQSSGTSFEGDNFSCGSLEFPLPSVVYINVPGYGVVDFEYVLTLGVSSQNCLSGSIASINNGGYGGLCSVPRYFYLGQVNNTGVNFEVIESPDALSPWGVIYPGNPDTSQITQITGYGTISSDGTAMSGTWSIPANLEYYNNSYGGATSTQSGSPCGATSGTWTALKQ